MHTNESRRPDRPDHPRRRTGRALVRLAAAAGVLGLLAAGCGDPEPTSSGQGNQLGSDQQVADVIKPASGEPRKGGNLRVGLDAETTEGWDPTDSRFAGAGITIARSIYDPLASIGADMKPKPYLAEAFTPSNNFQTWDIKLRPNIKFSNGEAYDATAVANFLEKFRKSPKVGSGLAPVQSVEVVDPLTVRLQMRMPWAQFPIALTVQPGLVPAPAQLASGPDAKSKPIGAGPFKLVKWETENETVLERNPDYWREGLPYLDKITYKPIPDDQTRYKAFQSGDLDVIISPREQTIQNLARDGQAGTSQFVRAKGDQDVNMLMFNVKEGPFSDIRLRRAVAHAIDRTQVLALYNNGPDVAATGVYTKDSKWYVETDYPQYDPEKAKQLVEEVKKEKGGAPLSFTLSTVPDTELNRVLQLLQQQLAQVGIDIKLDTTEQAQLIVKAITGDYEIMTWRQFGASDPDGNYPWWIGENADSVPALNMARNKDPEIDRALNAGRATTDEAARKELYGTVQKRLAEDLPYVFTTHLRWSMGARNNVRGLEGGTFPDKSKTAGFISAVLPINEMWLEG